MKKSIVKPKFLILIYLAGIKENHKRTKYWIRKSTSLGIQTMYDSLRALETMKLIIGKKAGESRTGQTMKYYYLTNNGWYKISTLPLNTINNAKKIIKGVSFSLVNHIELAKSKLKNGLYDEIQKKGEKATEERVDLLLENIRSVLLTKKAQIGYYFNLYIRTDKHGRVFYKYEVGNESVKKEIKEIKKLRRLEKKESKLKKEANTESQ